jgi:hypothetical protein
MSLSRRYGRWTRRILLLLCCLVVVLLALSPLPWWP